MSMRAIVAYIDYRLKANEEKVLFETFIAESIATMSAGMKYKERMKYSEARNKIWNIGQKDERSAKQIINDTFAARGIQVRWRRHNESV